ncbi:protein of unknown function [Hyphomicrobium sp. 1Nfss2.1]
MTAALASAVGHATAWGTPCEIIMKAMGQAAVGGVNGNAASQADIGSALVLAGWTGIAVKAVRAPLMTSANWAIASQGLVGIAGVLGAGGGTGPGSAHMNGLAEKGLLAAAALGLEGGIGTGHCQGESSRLVDCGAG